MIDIDDKLETQNSADSFDTTGLLLEYLAKWKWFLLSAVACLALAWLYVARQSPVYSIKASLYLNQETNSSALSLFSDQASILNLKDNIDEAELGILKSRNNLVKVVESLDLSYAYYQKLPFRFNYIYGTSPVKLALDSVALFNLKAPVSVLIDQNDNGGYTLDVTTSVERRKWRKSFNVASLPAAINIPQGRITLTAHPLQKPGDKKAPRFPIRVNITNPYDVASEISTALKVEFGKNTKTIVNIDYAAPSPEMGIDVINSMVKVYNEDIWIEKNRSAMQTEQFIVQRLALVEGELNDAERDVEDYRRANNITDLKGETTLALTRAQETDRLYAELDVQQRIAGEVESIVASANDYTPLPQILDQPALQAVITAYNKKLVQRATLLEGGTENNPLVKSVQDEIDNLRNEIYRGVVNLRKSIIVQRNDIRRQEDGTSSRLSSIPVNERELFGRIRKQTVKENIYNFLLEKREEIAIQKTLATPTARLIDDPNDAGQTFPKPRLFYLIGLIIGLLIPAAIIYLRRMLFPSFKDKDELARNTTVPILGEIAAAPAGREFVIAKGDSSSIAELFRLMRNSIQFLLTDDKQKVILVTSTISGEGKTFIAANIALTFALAGKKTLVIGMDIRRPFLAHRFNRDNDRGVTTYLSGADTDIDKMISQSDENENLYILSAGPVPPNPNELLMSGRLEGMINHLRGEYDIIIIDSAPIGVVSDTLLIAPYTDIQVYVTRANVSTKRCLETLHNALATGRLPRPYIIMNGVDIHSSAYTYKRYGHYGHNNKNYGYGYESSSSSKARPSFFSRLFRRR